MKKTMILLGAVALALILIVVLLLSSLFRALNPEQEELPRLEDYLKENWTIFSLRRYDADSGALELDYPLQFSYAQMEKYGASMDELRELPAGNLDTIASLKTAAREACAVRLQAVTVYGITSDGQVAYTVFPDGSVKACWESGESY